MNSSLLHAALDRLPRIFHKEADFQQALVWRLHEHFPSLEIRAEYPVEGYDIDLWIIDGDETMAVELKYPKRNLTGEAERETFSLGNDPVDVACYDYLEDITRLEDLVAGGECDRGGAVLLTNNSLFWDNEPSGTNYDDLMLYEGRTIGGTHSWSEEASHRSSQDRHVTLDGEYELTWQDYSYRYPSGATGHTTFRYCLTTIE